MQYIIDQEDSMPRRYRNRKTNTLAKKAYKLAKTNRRDIAGEVKAHDNLAGTHTTPLYNNLAILNTSGPVLVSGITQGDDHTSREGDQVKARSLLIRGAIRWQAAQSEAAVRMMLIMKRDNNTYTPTAKGTGSTTEIVYNMTTDIADVLAPLNWHTRNNYKVLWDDMFIGDPQRLENVIFKRFIRLNHKIYFGADNAPSKGNLYLLIYSDATADGPLITLNSRLKFVDN